MSSPLKVFITYSHKDKKAKDALITFLAVMVQNGLIDIWHDNEILPGDKWREAISNNLQSSDILLYMVSATSLASVNCNKELAEALEENRPRIVKIIPIILEACDWQNHPIKDPQALPDFGRPITTWRPRSDGWQNVVEGLRKRVEDMLISAQSPSRTKPEKPGSGNTAEQLQFANVLLRLGQLDKAVDAYSNIIQLDPQSTDAYTGRGVAKANLGRYEEAVADYDETLRLNPQSADAYIVRGVAKDGLGRYEEAVADFDEALRLDPQNADIYTGRGLAKASLGQYEAALTDFDISIDLNPHYAGAYTGRGLARAILGQHGAAIADYNTALDLNPYYADTYYNRGLARAILGQHGAAIADYNTALDLNPYYAIAYSSRGVAKGVLGRYGEARADFQRALELATEQGNEELVQLTQEQLNKLPPSN